ncbi:MAG: hypothetical protein N2504_01090 [candidate division WOR-3 bacterium]|nr:hypothetical protein [candidate division WOR-3 bacterium]MCX7947170.1 hypothetical protein [candidate division WOR-3 bacterium]MDW8150226.1 hypothetical protein [candidate division WOR-3 bacterium]
MNQVKHVENWINAEDKPYILLLEDEYFNDFLQNAKFSKKEKKFFETLKNSFSGYFEILNVNRKERKIKLKNLKTNDTIEVISELNAIKYDILISRIYEYKGNFYIFEDASLLLPRSYLYYIDLNENFINNYKRIVHVRLDIGVKMWDGFYRKRYAITGDSFEYREFIKILKKSNAFKEQKSEDIGNYYIALLRGEISKRIKRMPILIEEKPIVDYIIGFVWITSLKFYIIIGGYSANFTLAILDIFKDIYKVEGTSIVFTYKDKDYYASIDIWQDFNEQYDKDAIYDFYHSNRYYSEEEFKFYYNLEARFKEIGALNFLEILESKYV